MAHWFHRNPIKASAPVSFEAIRHIATNASSSKILSDLKQSRSQLLSLLTDPANDVTAVKQAYEQYFSFLVGLVHEPSGSGESKLRKLIMFKWTNSICGNTPTCSADGVFEMISMCINVALWYTKHAAKMAAKEDITMEEAKEVHTCLRTAGGMFQYVKDGLLSQLGDISAEKGADTDGRVLEAYKMQCVAEAQEVTVARAVELKHKASLVASLANETSGLFTSAGDALKSVDDLKAGKWRKYLELKAAFYLSYARCFQGELLLDEEECGKAISALQDSDKMYKKAEALCKEYASTRGPGTTARPQEHPFFKRIGPLMKTRLDKATRENGFIYFHKVPTEPPDLELKATYGLASPQEFSPPAPAPTWVDAYAAFDASKAQPPKTTGGEDVKPVNEAEDKGPVKPAKNSSGCTIS
ncbi:BRO1 domain-containing protein BROX [Exaiptasia diaphana]|uniref:BRO1 domain-containing protein n=1 Tax=Exaiptasia diaphana TaxID=2652724 RepID=A0A913WVV5_EXADI|nr:BRO1 domain-containing protein BROX [Exaiptasia diaphana]KXJ17469.1 BRO1 domain-containing protein BROX [Exaiptasia diaphana]